MRRGDAKHRRVARLTTTAEPPTPGARGPCPRAFRAKRSTQARAKAQLSLGYLVTKSIVTGMPSSSNRSRSWFSTQ